MSKWNKKSKTMHRYDLTAEMYEMRYAEEQEAKFKAALENVRISASSIILDVGCGSGLLFKHIASRAHTVVGVDISTKLLGKAKKSAARFQNVYLIKADADYLPLRSTFFHIAFAFTVLQNLPKPLQTLIELKRIARTDAILVVTGLKKVFPLKSFKMLLKNAGLKVFSLKESNELKCHVVVSIRR